MIATGTVGAKSAVAAAMKVGRGTLRWSASHGETGGGGLPSSEKGAIIVPGSAAAERDDRSRPSVATNAMLAVVLIALVVLMAVTALRVQRPPAPDFYFAYLPAAHRLLTGASPYAVSHQDVVAGIAFVYPALSAVVFAPFALLGRSAADYLYVVICFLLVPATLWVARVRDWRVYGLPLLWAPVVLGWEGGNVSVPLTFLVALTWRYRDRPAAAGLITAVAISLKPFVWPLALWLLVTRRWRAAGYALLGGLVVNLLAWAVVGFDQIQVYVSLSRAVTDALWRGGYSMLALAHHLGLGRGTGELLLMLTSGVLVLAVCWTGLVKQGDRQALILSVALMLIASPLVWSHYFVLLLVPLALTFPRLTPIWLLPVAMWICPPSTTATGREVMVAWLVAMICLIAACRGGPVGRRPAGRRPQKTPPTKLAISG